MEVRIDHLKLDTSNEFGAFAARTFGSVSDAREWIAAHVPRSERNLIRVRIDRREISGRELEEIAEA
jgi:hypothetical protein